MRVTDEMVEAAARAQCAHAGFDPDEIMSNDGPRWQYYAPGSRAALEAALAVEGTEAELARDGNPFGWVRRSETDGNPPAYHFTCNKTTAEKWARRGESPTALYTTPPAGIREALKDAETWLEGLLEVFNEMPPETAHEVTKTLTKLKAARAALRGQS